MVKTRGKKRKADDQVIPVQPARHVVDVPHVVCPTNPPAEMPPCVPPQDHEQDYGEDPVAIPTINISLGSHVSPAIKSKICLGHYIDLGSLLEVDPNQDLDIQAKSLGLSSSGQLVVSPIRKPKRIYTIAKWTDAFLIFMTIYIDNHPGKTKELIKYLHDIRLGAERHSAGWLQYDQQFRLRIASNPSMSWGQIDYELWLIYMNPQAITSGNPVVASVKRCYDFNYSSCSRPVCQYSHTCLTCSGHHPCRSCQRSSHLNGPRAQTSRGGYRPSFTPRQPSGRGPRGQSTARFPY